jgi:signal transduction histidine kinase/DNA-binding response OmpR family regulator/HAMP domain-containing protein
MALKDQKIGTLLMLGFGAMLGFVIILGFVSYRQSAEIHQKTEDIYNHPMKVERALGHLEADILSMRLGNRDLMLAKNEQEKQASLLLMSISETNAENQFDIIKSQYMGPKSDVDEAYKAFLNWKTAREENTKLALSGDIEKVKQNIISTGAVGIYRNKMLNKIKVIDDYANQKGEDLYLNSVHLRDTLSNKLILLVCVIILLSLIISYYLLRYIRTPIEELTDAATRFRNGDMSARSLHDSKNEFGLLGESFNSMVESIQINADLQIKASGIVDSMLIEEDANEFFQTFLPVLANTTNSQIVAVYLLSNDKKHFEHFESIGMTNTTKQIFAAKGFEGELGLAISSRKIQHVKNIPIDTRFVFQTVSGKFIPREIITIPILAGKEVSAVISLASVRTYSEQTNMLIDKIYDTLNARVEGILAYRKMKEFSKKLEHQNTELESQKMELASQSTVLIEQNTELEMQKNQLSEANKLKTSFLSNMSHELRTPLNSVIALSGVLNRRLAKKIPDEEYSYLEVIERNGKNLLELINDILDISRIESGREETEITRFKVNDLITEIINLLSPQTEMKELEIFQTRGVNDIYVTSDERKCRHILQNLISNAVKFTEKGKVEISVEQNGNVISIKIADTGIGISEDNLSHIFDEFRQADGSTSRKYGGTGLGLAIARKYANLLGGSISVKSVLNEGSVFTLTLPLSYNAENRIVEEDTPTIRIAKTNSQVPQNLTSGKTILLVEDSEPAIIQIKDFLEESGYRILVAHDGGEALRIIEKTIPNAMILDLMMPGIDGFEVLNSLRSDEATAYIPVLVLTAKQITKDDLKSLKRNNVYQLIQKGDVNRTELITAVAKMVTSVKEEIVKPQRNLQTIEGLPTVLIVEDNTDNMMTVKAILAGNYNVIGMADGTEIEKVASECNPNLILMDIGLPGMDGVKVLKVLRNNSKFDHIPVIALTASALTLDRENIMSQGFDAYLAKPIEEKVFFKTINDVLYGK